MNFDRVSAVYDATRVVPDNVMNQVVECIQEATHAGPDTTFLELGVGTGRIAVPFVRRGFAYTGVDISSRMVEQLKSKVGEARNLTVVIADIVNLPFPDAIFDIVLTVHVLHLVPEWRRALGEALRVLRPHGYFVEAHDLGLPGDPAALIRRQWRAFVEEAGTELRPDYGTWHAVETELADLGFRTADYRAAAWTRGIRPIELLEQQRNRTYSLSWSVPDDVLEAVHERMLEWVTEKFGDPGRELSTRWEFMVSVSRYSP